MVLKVGEKVHAIFRRSFESDIRRHFIGEVTGVAEAVIRVQGYSFIFDQSTNQFVRKPEERTRVVSMVDAGVIQYSAAGGQNRQGCLFNRQRKASHGYGWRDILSGY